MNGASLTASVNVGGSADWSAVGTGDFNGDGKTDLEWRQASTGSTVIWLLDGATSGSVIASAANEGGSADWGVTTSGGSTVGGAGGAGGGGGAAFWLTYSAKPASNTSGGRTGIYVLPSNLSTTTPQLVPSSAGALPYSPLGLTLDYNLLLNSHVLQPRLIMYGNTDAGNNVHVYSLNVGNTASLPTPVQVSSFSSTLAQWCGSGGNGTVGSGSGGIGSGPINAAIPTSEFVIVETAGVDGTCFTSDDTYTVVNNATGTATQVPITPVQQTSEPISPLVSPTGVLQGILVFDASDNLYFYKDLTFTSPSILVAGARPIALLGSSGAPMDFTLTGLQNEIIYNGTGVNGVRFLQLADAGGVSYLYALINNGGTPTATKVYTASGTLSFSGYADNTYLYFTDTVSGTTPTVNIVRLPLSGAATPVTLYSVATTDSISLLGSDGAKLVYTDSATQTVAPFATTTTIDTLPVTGPGSPTTIATFSSGYVQATLVTASNGAPASALYVTVSTVTLGGTGVTYGYSSEVLSLTGTVSNALPNSVFLNYTVSSLLDYSIFRITGITDSTVDGYGGGALSTLTFSTGVSKPVTYLPGGAPYTVPAGNVLGLELFGIGDVYYVGGQSVLQGAGYNPATNQLTTFGFTNTEVLPFL
jgi:hypothetical protein